jgi:hypothetical protein
VWVTGAALLAASAGCTRTGQGTKLAPPEREVEAAPPSGPTLRDPARLVPLEVHEDVAYGVEPGGGRRGLEAGVRVVSMPGGAILVADDRLPSPPTITLALPARLGGGFLFVIGTVVWRAERWLAPARPLFATTTGIVRAFAGLDRVYLRLQNGAHQAIDARTGAPLDLGPWPGSSYVGGYAAVDGWRAAAIVDLRGVVATFDAGATWHPLDVPIDARDVSVAGDVITVSGVDAAHAPAWFEVRADGQTGRLAGAPGGAPVQAEVVLAPLEGPARALGRRPLAAVVEDGWPQGDGTAVVARDGALAHVRLADGLVIDAVADAYSLKPSRCHAIAFAPLAPAGGDGFGFVCGEPRGATILYSYDRATGRMVEAKRFDVPRAVIASGNGAVAVRGSCAAAGPSDETDTYCVRGRAGAFHEVHLAANSGTRDDRVVVLGDGRVVVLTPPHGDLMTAELSILEPSGARVVPLRFARLGLDTRRVLTAGAWIDGFEERRSGVLGGWVEAAGTMLGVEVQLDGEARAGELVRDAGTPMVSGRYGLGWTASRRGYATTNGGMTWTPLDVPEPLPTAVTSRACGPIGCSAAGWLRIGWGEVRASVQDDPTRARAPRLRNNVTLALTCEATGPVPAASARPSQPPPSQRAAPAAAPARLVLAPFYNVLAPTLRPDERGVAYEAGSLADHTASSLGTLARVYAWGPRTADWEQTSRWMVRWLWPFGGARDIHSTQVARAPAPLVEMARFGAGNAYTTLMPLTYGLVPGADAAHVLLLASRTGRSEQLLYALEADRPPVEVRRADGEPFTGWVSATMQTGGAWYLATPSAQGELSTTVIWRVEGGRARELVRIPRAAAESRNLGGRLARRSDGRALALIVDGEPGTERYAPLRWALPIDIDSGRTGEPEPLGPSDLGDRTSLPLCTDDFAGWTLDAPLATPVALATTAHQPLGSLQSAFARVRLAPGRACVERLAGRADGETIERPGPSVPRLAPRADEPVIVVSALATHAREELACAVRR